MIKKLIFKLIRISGYIFYLVEIDRASFIIFNFYNLFLDSINNSSWSQIIFIALPHSIIWTIYSTRAFYILIYLIIYYIINVLYIKSKLQLINKNLENYVKTHRNVIQILKQLNNIYNEINEYNKILYSKMLCLYWFSATILYPC